MASVVGDRQSPASPEMRRVIWTEQAREDLIAIRSYVQEFNLPAAIRLAVRLNDLAESLAAFPDRGRAIRHGLREATTIRPYVIRYAVLPDEVQIITIRHSARRPER